MVNVKQISVFLENKSGRLVDVCQALAEENINIRALSIADTTDFGILRLIVDKPVEAFKRLKRDGFAASETEVIAVAMPDNPGGLANVLECLATGGVNLEYLYAFGGKREGCALVVFRVDDIPSALSILSAAKITVLPSELVYSL